MKMLVGAKRNGRCVGVRGSVMRDFNLGGHVMHVCVIGINERDGLIPE